MLKLLTTFQSLSKSFVSLTSRKSLEEKIFVTKTTLEKSCKNLHFSQAHFLLFSFS